MCSARAHRLSYFVANESRLEAAEAANVGGLGHAIFALFRQIDAEQALAALIDIEELNAQLFFIAEASKFPTVIEQRTEVRQTDAAIHGKKLDRQRQ